MKEICFPTFSMPFSVSLCSNICQIDVLFQICGIWRHYMELWLVLTFLRLRNCDNTNLFPRYQARKKSICSGTHNGLNMPDLTCNSSATDQWSLWGQTQRLGFTRVLSALRYNWTCFSKVQYCPCIMFEGW